MRQIIVYPGMDGYWVAECPSLPGCISQGETREEVIKNMKEAIDEYVSALIEDGLPVPDVLTAPKGVDEAFARQVSEFIDQYRPALEALAQA